MTKYGIKMTCYDFNNPKPYEDKPSGNPLFETKESAFDYACRLADEESEYLNETCEEELTSFGNVIDEKEDKVTVYCYMLASPLDMTGETETVTIYEVAEYVC